jgi:hypothetical protein
MIIDMPDTTTNHVNRRLVRLRDEGGAVALGRVLTLVVLADERDVEEAVATTNDASREHPCRVIVVAPAGDGADARLDAQIRVGGDAGASEVVVRRPPLWPPSVSTIEKPHGDQVPVAPISSPAAARAISRTLNRAPWSGST